MKKLFYLTALFASFAMFNTASADVIGVVDFDKIVANYSKVKSVSNEISDKYAEIQRYGLDKEREYKKLSTPLERKNFEEATAKELAKKQEAYLKLAEEIKEKYTNIHVVNIDNSRDLDEVKAELKELLKW